MFLTDLNFIIPMAFLGSGMLTYLIIPKIIWVVNEKELIDHPEERSSHEKSTPTMAGVSFFLTLIIALFFMHPWDVDDVTLNIITGVTIVFALGLKDDLVISSPQAKLLGEIVAIIFILSNPIFQIGTLNGFLGVEEIPLELGYLLSGLIILTIINAYNLIDGIDGLASSIGIVIFLIYGGIFYVLEMYFYVLLCASLIGILVAFLRYNLSHYKKIFMGDTGSLLIGLCIGILSIKFLSLEPQALNVFDVYPENKLIIIAIIFIVPLFDTFRVMGVRILNNKSPFFPDRNHVHHILIDRGLSHIKAAIFLSVGNICAVVLFVYLSTHFNSAVMVGLLIAFFLLLLVFYFYLRLENIKKGRTISKLNTT